MLPKDPDNKPWRDEIVAETRARREDLFASFGYDIDKLVRYLQESQRSKGHEVVRLPPRRVESGSKA
jgi:hypothetical protein